NVGYCGESFPTGSNGDSFTTEVAARSALTPMDGIVDINTLFGPLPSAAADLSIDDLTTLMTEHEVAVCCTLSTIGFLLDHNSGNAATRAACSENSRLIPVATINPQAYFGGDGPHAKLR